LFQRAILGARELLGRHRKTLVKQLGKRLSDERKRLISERIVITDEIADGLNVLERSCND
jgi:hypothetical protein